MIVVGSPTYWVMITIGLLVGAGMLVWLVGGIFLDYYDSRTDHGRRRSGGGPSNGPGPGAGPGDTGGGGDGGGGGGD